MECYFGSVELPEDNPLRKSAVVTFFIPDLGIRFKAPFSGVNEDHCDFASLLALLEFIDSNQKYFSNQTYEILGNNQNVVNQVNLQQSVPDGWDHLLQKALDYRRKYRFSLRLVDPGDNSAIDSELH